jgi:hypothetical protein
MKIQSIIKSFLVPATLLVSATPALGADSTTDRVVSSESAEPACGSDAACPFSFYAHLGVNSDYVFRGLNLYNGVSIQPGVGVFYDMGDAGRLGASVWMHIPGEEQNRDTIDLTSVSLNQIDDIFAPRAKFVELDPTLSYDLPIGDMLMFSVGHTWYTDPKKGRVDVIFPVLDESGNLTGTRTFNLRTSRGDTSEFYLGFALDTILNPEFTFVHDYRLYEYEYYTLGFSQPIPISDEKDFSVTPYVTFAWSTGNDTDISSDTPTSSGFYSKNGLVHVNVGMSASVTIENFTVKPNFNYVFVQDDALGPDDIVWIGFDIDFSS